MKKRRVYTKDFKIVALNLANEKGNYSRAVEELGINSSFLRRWNKELSIYKKGAFQGNGNALLTDDQKRIIQLEKENRELKLDRQILKEAMSIFSEKRHKS